MPVTDLCQSIVLQCGIHLEYTQFLLIQREILSIILTDSSKKCNFITFSLLNILHHLGCQEYFVINLIMIFS